MDRNKISKLKLCLRDKAYLRMYVALRDDMDKSPVFKEFPDTYQDVFDSYMEIVSVFSRHGYMNEHLVKLLLNVANDVFASGRYSEP